MPESRRISLLFLLLAQLLLMACGEVSKTPMTFATSSLERSVGKTRPREVSGVALEKTVGAVSTPTYRTTRNLMFEDMNKAARQRFLAAYGRGQPSRWEYVITTNEGDPISYLLIYEGLGKQVRLVYDTTRDKFAGEGGRRVTQYSCQALRERADDLLLINCDGDGQHADRTVP